MASKADIINDAYSQLRISGITVIPTPEDIGIALSRLEDMAEELNSQNVSVGYNFEDNPNVSTASGVPRFAMTAFSSLLARRLCADFGKEPTNSLMAVSAAALSNLYARTASAQQMAPPSRQPRGSGNTIRVNRWQRFYPPAVQIPVNPATNYMLVGETNSYTESWSSYLNDGEDIASFTIDATPGLTIVSSTLSTPDVSYVITAVGSTEQVTTNIYTVRITVTTTDARVDIRQISFVVAPPEPV